MRTLAAIRADLITARAEYQKAVEAENAVAAAEHARVVAASNAVKALNAELSATIGEGALPCKTCGNVPHAMKRRPGYYEVGCAGPCKVDLPHPFEGYTLPEGRAPFVHGETPEEAVAAWNASEYAA